MGHVYITCVEVIQQYYITCDFVGNNLETCWKNIGFYGNLLEATPA